MRIVDRYSLAGAEELLRLSFPRELAEVEAAIQAIDAESCRVKRTREERRTGLLYSPIAINYCLLGKQLHLQGWDNPDRKRAISHSFPATDRNRRIPLSMDGIKNRVGVENQLGKYAFLEYDVLAKMPIYHREGLIDVGIEVAIIRPMVEQMSSGVGDYERLVTNLVHRGDHSDDFPVLVLGIGPDPPGTTRSFTVRFEDELAVANAGNSPGPGRRRVIGPVTLPRDVEG